MASSSLLSPFSSASTSVCSSASASSKLSLGDVRRNLGFGHRSPLQLTALPNRWRVQTGDQYVSGRPAASGMSNAACDGSGRHQRADMGRGAGRQRLQVVAAFEGRDHAAAAAWRRPRPSAARSPRRSPPPPARSAASGSRDGHRSRPRSAAARAGSASSAGSTISRHGGAELARARHRRQRHVDDIADAGLAPAAPVPG